MLDGTLRRDDELIRNKLFDQFNATPEAWWECAYILYIPEEEIVLKGKLEWLENQKSIT